MDQYGWVVFGSGGGRLTSNVGYSWRERSMAAWNGVAVGSGWREGDYIEPSRQTMANAEGSHAELLFVHWPRGLYGEIRRGLALRQPGAGSSAACSSRLRLHLLVIRRQQHLQPTHFIRCCSPPPVTGLARSHVCAVARVYEVLRPRRLHPQNASTRPRPHGATSDGSSRDSADHNLTELRYTRLQTLMLRQQMLLVKPKHWRSRFSLRPRPRLDL